MTELSPEDRALLDLARDGHEPNELDRRRVRGAVAARLGAGMGVAVSIGAASSATSAGTGVGVAAMTAGGGSVAAAIMKATLAVTLVAAAGGGGLWAYRAGRSIPASRTAQPAEGRPVKAVKALGGGAAPQRTPPAVGAASDTSPSLAPTPPVVGAPSRRHAFSATGRLTRSRGTPTARSVAAGEQVAPPLSPALPNIVAEEIRLVQGGVEALHAQNAQGALSLFNEYARLYPGGVLAEECSAERVIALCSLGRAGEARASAQLFVRTYPRSPLMGRVLESCGGQANP